MIQSMHDPEHAMHDPETFSRHLLNTSLVTVMISYFQGLTLTASIYSSIVLVLLLSSTAAAQQNTYNQNHG